MGEVVNITCFSKDGVPPAQFQWFIEQDTESIDITTNSTSADGESILLLTAERNHNGSDIVCKVTQRGFFDERNSSTLLTVMCE